MNAREDSVSTCPWCKALLTGRSGYCWKCGARLVVDEQGRVTVVADYADTPQQEPAGFNYSVSTLLLVTTLIAICLALAVAAPGLGIFLAIVSLPPFIRTLLLVQKKKTMGDEIPAAAKIGLFLGSLGVTLVVTFVTLFVSLLAFCLSCLGAFTVSDASNARSSESFAMTLASLFTLVIAGLLLWAFSKWFRKRWQRDLKL